jgi:hypothetical protein
MSDKGSSSGASTERSQVEIRVKGRLEPRWSTWFDGLDVTAQPDGTTVIHGPVVDQAALFGVLQRLRDLALPLISVVHVDPTTTHSPSAAQSKEPS